MFYYSHTKVTGNEVVKYSKHVYLILSQGQGNL